MRFSNSLLPSAAIILAIMIILFPLSCHKNQSALTSETSLALLSGYNDVCHSEIEKKIKAILKIKSLRLSKEVFQKEEEVILSNIKVSDAISSTSDMSSSPYSSYYLILHTNDAECLLSLLDKKKNVIKRVQLTKCKCIEK
jgi:hypothetical protein